MMKVIKLGAIMALCVGGQALGQTSKISYMLELGGNNHASGAAPSWENPTGCVPPAFTPGSTSDGQSFSGVVTWAARVFVSGTHSNSFAPSGVANLVANLELRQGSATGPLVTGFGHGGPSTKGYFSTINDGDGDGLRSTPPINGGCGFPPDPLEDAAFAVSFDIFGGSATARVIDHPDDGGPFLDYFMYPSTVGYPAGSTATDGLLLGVGAGYSRYAGYGCPSDCGFGSGLNTAGVGRTTAASCGVALGNGPVFEGQLNTSGLTNGTYVLVLVPGTGNNIVNGDFLCDSADPGAFALSPDLATDGDTITFVVNDGVIIENRSITQWRSVRTHTGAGELPIVLNATATGNGSGGPTVETRGLGAGLGIQKIQVDFNGAITLGNTANLIVTRYPTNQGVTPTLAAPENVVPSSVVLADSDTLNILFAAGQIPNLSCLDIVIGPGTIVETIVGDADCKIRALQSDVGGNGTVTNADVLQTKSSLGVAVPPATRFDFNLSGGVIAQSDQLAAKNQNINPTKTALCP